MSRRVPDDIAIRVAKAILWEEAKAKLRALSAVEGQTFAPPPGSREAQEEPRYKRIRARVEKFIKDFELDELHD